MWPTVAVLLYLIYFSYAEQKISDILTYIDADLAKLKTTGLKLSEFEALSGNILRRHSALGFISVLLRPCVESIGIQEARKVLNFPSPGHWQHHNWTDPSKKELDDATIEEYYNLREPRNAERTLDSDFVSEQNVQACIAYLDKRLPIIRATYSKVFRANAPDEVDKDGVDRMVQVLEEMFRKFDQALFSLNTYVLRKPNGEYVD